MTASIYLLDTYTFKYTCFMGQVTIYLDEELTKKMRDRAKQEGVSQSQWVARLIGTKLASSWPASVSALAGAWPDFPELSELRQAPGEDTAREPF